MKNIKKIDFIFFGFMVLTTLQILIVITDLAGLMNILLPRFVIVIGVGVLLYCNQKISNRTLNFLRNVYPIFVSGFFYSETIHYNKLFFDDIDPYLIALEYQLFSSQPSVSFSSYFNSLLFSEMMYIGYFSFYLLIIGFTVYTYFKKTYLNEQSIFILCSSLYIYYYVFALIPAQGPQFFFDSPLNNLPKAYMFDKVMHFIQAIGEQPTGAFPSSHVAISLIILMISKDRAPQFFRIALPFSILLILSTVYIKAHYVVDVLAAFITAPLVLHISKSIYNLKIDDRPVRPHAE